MVIWNWALLIIWRVVCISVAGTYCLFSSNSENSYSPTISMDITKSKKLILTWYKNYIFWCLSNKTHIIFSKEKRLWIPENIYINFFFLCFQIRSGFMWKMFHEYTSHSHIYTIKYFYLKNKLCNSRVRITKSKKLLLLEKWTFIRLDVKKKLIN